VPGYEVETGPKYKEVVRLNADAWEHLDLSADGDFLIWAEDERDRLSIGSDTIQPIDMDRVVTRATARKCDTLFIRTTPPSPRELEQMLDLTQPRSVVDDPSVLKPRDTPTFVLERLAGLVKYAQENYPEGVALVKIASALAQREVTVRRGLEWMAAKGVISLEWTEDERVKFGPGGPGDPDAVEPLQDAIQALLAETRAYRAYFRAADLSAMIR
jgi:single-stranded-DNA-specific exonuclease